VSQADTEKSSARVSLARGVPLVWPDDPDAGPRPAADDPTFVSDQLRSLQRALEETT